MKIDISPLCLALFLLAILIYSGVNLDAVVELAKAYLQNGTA